MPLDRTTRAWLWLCAAALGLFALVLLINAWVVDDAYITFRTVDNFVHGYGLRWNVDERVQVYTHPLWMLLFTPFYAVTREAFFTSIFLNLGLTLTAVLIAAWSLTRGLREQLWRAPLLLLALLSCKAFVDYASSGLENPLSYVLVALMFVAFQRGAAAKREFSRRDLGVIALLTSLAFLNHPDLALAFLPALLLVAAIRLRREARATVGVLALGTLPAIVWVVFSMIYYGFPVPNTAYAKALAPGFPAAWIRARGVEYLANSLSWDTAAYVMVAAALVWCVVGRRWRALVLVAGVLVHLAFVVLKGAAATHMSGRFLSATLFLGILVFLGEVTRPRLGLAVAALLAIFVAVSPVSSVKFGTSAYQKVTKDQSFIDTKWYAAQEGAALIDWRPGKAMPDDAWYHAGEQARLLPDKVLVGGAPGSDAIGYFGFAAGPDKFIVDRLGLSDPLLARLPAVRPKVSTAWKSGHFPRLIPAGYLESVAADADLVTDPRLAEYYAAIRRVTRGPLFSMARFREIWALNVGAARHGPAGR